MLAAFVAWITHVDPAFPGVRVVDEIEQVPEVTAKLTAPDPDPPEEEREIVLPKFTLEELLILNVLWLAFATVIVIVVVAEL